MTDTKFHECAHYSDDAVINVIWKLNHIRIVLDAIKKYKQCLEPKTKAGATQIIREVDLLKKMIMYIGNIYVKANNADEIEMPLSKGWLKKINCLIRMYWSIKNQILSENKKIETIEAALEGDINEVEEIRKIMQYEAFQYVGEDKLLIQDFSCGFPEHFKKDEKKEGNATIHIEHLTGQATFGNNFGIMVQNQNGGEAIKLLNELKELIEKSSLNSEQKKDAIVDINTTELQLAKSQPDNRIIQNSFENLSRIVNLIQFSEYALKAPEIYAKLKIALHLWLNH